MLPVAGNIQTARKNDLSQNYPFRRGEDEDEDDCEQQLPPTEYDDSFVWQARDNKPKLRRDFLRDQFRRKATQTIMKQAQEQYEVLRRQEVERTPLRKPPDYYMTRDNSNEPQYNLYKTDDMTTYWSFGGRSNSSRRRNTTFTKPISEQLDQQFG